MKHTKTLGLLAILALALAAFVGTSSASAAPQFTAGKTGAKILETTIENHVFTVNGQQVTCTNTEFAGTTLALAYAVQKVSPTYKNCTAGGLEATVDTAGCVYELNANGNTTLTGCTKGGITIKVDLGFLAKCHVHIKNQTISGSVVYSNGLNDVVTAIHGVGIHAEVTTSDGLCPLTVGTYTAGVYVGRSTVQAEGTTLTWDA
jgi:hypothetical protein